MMDGLKWWLLHLLIVRSLLHSCRAQSTAPKQVQLPNVDPAKQFAVDFRMQSTSYAAYMMVRDYQTSDAAHCNYPGLAADVCKWSSKDPGWERLVRAESMVAIAHQAFRTAEYDEAIIALEESLALRLFAYTDQKTLDRWQQGLVMPGAQYRHDKKAIADSLVLRSDCLVQLARVNQDVAELTEATELLQLAAAELQAGQSLTTDSMAAISSRMSSIAALAAELLPRLSVGRLQDLLEQYGISCSGGGSSTGSNATSGSSGAPPPEWCGSPGELLMNLVPLLRLPVCLVGPCGRMLSSSLGCTSNLHEQQHKGAQQRQQQQQPKLAKGQVPKVEPVSDPFGSIGTALIQKPCEVVAHYLQRMFFRLLSVVPVEYMRDLHVPCQRTDARSRCMSYLPAWVTAQAVTIDKRTGKAHVTGPSSCAVSSSGGSPADPGACASAHQSSQQQGTSSCAAAGTGHTQQQQQGGLELCGFLHIRALAPGVQLPMVDGELSPEQQEVFRRAQEAAAVHHDQPVQQVPPSCPVGTQASQGCGANPGVYYYFFPDIPAVLDHIILTQDYEDSMYLLSQLDSLTQTHSLRRLLQKRNKGSDCTEASLLEGRAPPGCSALVPSIGDCSAQQQMQAPGSPSPMSQLPSNLTPPPAAGSYTPKSRARLSAAVAAAATAAAAPAPACAAGAAPAAGSRKAHTCGGDGRSSRAGAAGAAGARQESGGPDSNGGGEGSVSKRGRRHKSTDSYSSEDDSSEDDDDSGSSRRNSNGSKRRRSKQAADPYLDSPPYPHMYNSFARVDREIADRQLLEQLNKIQRDKQQQQHDGPLIPLTLGMLVLIVCLPFIASRFRARSRQLQQQPQGLLGALSPWRARKAAAVTGRSPGGPLGAAPCPASSGGSITNAPAGVPAAYVAVPAAGVAGVGAAGGVGSSGSVGSIAADSSRIQRAAAAAVKAALSSSDVEGMEAALRQAEAAGMGNNSNCVRLRELYTKRRKQAQQAKRQELLRQQEQARRGKKEKSKKGMQEQPGPAAAAPEQQQDKGGEGSDQQQQQQVVPPSKPKKTPNRISAWFKRVFTINRDGKGTARNVNSASEGLDRVSELASAAAAAAGGSFSRSCSLSSSRSASSSMISSSPSTGAAAAAQLQMLADSNANSSGSSRGSSPTTSSSCSPQASLACDPSGGVDVDAAAAVQRDGRDRVTAAAGKRSGSRGSSVTVAVAPRGSSSANAKQQQQQQQSGGEGHAGGSSYPGEEVLLVAGHAAVVQPTSTSSRGSNSSSSPQKSTAGAAAAASKGAGRAAKSAKKQQQQQQQQGGYADVVPSLDVASPTAAATATAGGLPIYSPPRRSSSGSGGAVRQAGSRPAAAAAAIGAKDGKGDQAWSVSVAAAAIGCDSDFGQQTPTAVITSDGSGSAAGRGFAGNAADGGGFLPGAYVEPPATPAGAVAASPLRSERLQQQQQPQQHHLPPPWQQQQQQQQQRAVRSSMSWLEAACPSKQRTAAVSEDGTTSNNSSCLNSPAAAAVADGSNAAAAGGAATSVHSTPTKAKLNPKATPYNPKGFATSPGSAAAAVAAGQNWHSPAPSAPGLIHTPSPQGAAAVNAAAGSNSWQQQQGMLAARGAVSVGGGLAGAVAGVASMLQHQEGAGPVGRRVSASGILETSGTSGGVGGLAPPPGQLMGGMSATNVQHLLLLQQQQQQMSYVQQQQAAAAWQQQQLQELQHEQQLMAMLSALSPDEASAAAAAIGLRGGGSAPQPLGTAGSSGSSGVTSSGVTRVDSSSTGSSGDYRGHLLDAAAAAAASQGLGWMAAGGDRPSLGRPPLGGPRGGAGGLSGALSWQQQQQQLLPGVQKPGRLALPQDLDSQLPPGFSSETFHAVTTPGSGTAITGPYSTHSSTTAAGAFSPAGTPHGHNHPLASPASVVGVGLPGSSTPMLAGVSNPWSFVPAQGKPATPLLIVSEAATTGPLGMQGYGPHGVQRMDMDHAMNMDMVAAAAATSANVAELVLGSSPPVDRRVASLPGMEEMFYRPTAASSNAGGGYGSNADGCYGSNADGGYGSNADGRYGSNGGAAAAGGMTAADADAHAARLADEMTAGVLDCLD